VSSSSNQRTWGPSRRRTGGVTQRFLLSRRMRSTDGSLSEEKEIQSELVLGRLVLATSPESHHRRWQLRPTASTAIGKTNGSEVGKEDTLRSSVQKKNAQDRSGHNLFASGREATFKKPRARATHCRKTRRTAIRGGKN